MTSCRQTHRRKSDGSTPSFCSVATMLGTTSSRRPPEPKTSYWPSTREDRKASSRRPGRRWRGTRSPSPARRGGCPACRRARRPAGRAVPTCRRCWRRPSRAGRRRRPRARGRRDRVSPVSAWTCATAVAAASCDRGRRPRRLRTGAHQAAGGPTGEGPVDHRGGAAHRPRYAEGVRGSGECRLSDSRSRPAWRRCRRGRPPPRPRCPRRRRPPPRSQQAAVGDHGAGGAWTPSRVPVLARTVPGAVPGSSSPRSNSVPS